jgi:hypothetical protein
VRAEGVATKRTLTDWLSHAGSASDPEEVKRCLHEAVGQAASCWEWRAILGGAGNLQHVPRELLSEIAEHTLRAATEEREVWGFRDVAAVKAARLDDEKGARAALEAAEDIFHRPRTDLLGEVAGLVGGHVFARGYEWALLAQGYLETLHDDAGMRRCLQAGRDMARVDTNADDLCSIATAWATHIDRSEGFAFLLEAETLAKNGSAQPWTLANAWKSLGEPDAVRRVLDTALRAATTTDGALHVAMAWMSHGMKDDGIRGLSRAQEFAATASEWLAIGEAAFDAGLDKDRIRECVGHAEGLVSDDELRGRVSAAYRLWLLDAESAARVGPRGLRPEALRVRVRALEGWETSASALFDWLRARATPEMLSDIANADYGMDANKHLAALQDICETGLVPRILAWEPHEVLALRRWSTGEGVNHRERALCCVILCLAPSDLDELVTNGPILAESCLALGAEATDLAERFFAWRSETEASSEDPEDVGPEQPIALLLLFLLRAATMPDDPRLQPLSQMLVEHPSYRPEQLSGWISGSMRSELWEDLLGRILTPLQTSHAHTGRLLRALGRS